MKVRAVLFDVDDTLVDTVGAFRAALLGVARDYLPHAVSEPDVLRDFWRADRHGYYRAHTRGELDHRAQRMLRANDLHARFGGPAMDDEAYDSWNADFERYFRDAWRPHDDAATALDALDIAGIPYAGLSNADLDYQRMKLAACGLERVPMLVGVDTLGIGKPAPEVFVLGCDLMGFAPAEVAYVGDEPDIDTLAAAAAGLLGVWLARPGAHGTEKTIDAITITSLRDLAAALA